MGSCFEGLFKRDIIVQSKFEFDGWFKNYNFFKFWNYLHMPLSSQTYSQAIIKSLSYSLSFKVSRS